MVEFCLGLRGTAPALRNMPSFSIQCCKKIGKSSMFFYAISIIDDAVELAMESTTEAHLTLN